MEPRGLLAEWDDGQRHLTVSGAAKVPFHNRRILAKQMGLPEDAITMIEADVGGGFGVRGEFYPEDFLIPFAARKLEPPGEMDRGPPRASDRHRTMPATPNASWRSPASATAPSSACAAGRAPTSAPISAPTASPPARNIAQVLSGPYRMPNIHFDIALLLTNKTPSGTYRGPGRFEADFFRERLFDMAANDLGIDRVEFRRRNLDRRARDAVGAADRAAARPGQRDRQRRLPADARPLPAGVRLGGESEAAGQADRRPLPRHRASAAISKAAAPGPRENVRMVLERDGTVSLYVGSSSVGQGVETVMAQIAADALEMPMERINRVQHGSTTM